jgi:CshA-type fibril repeat protein
LTNGSGQRYWDLSALPVSITGQNPNFKVQFIGLTATTDAQISISAEGGSPQLCLTPVTVVKCPTGLGVLDQAALVATATTVTGSGSSTVGGTTTPLTSSTSNLSVSAPSIADCSSSLRGRAGYSGNGGTGDPVAGATVRLLNSSGQPVLDAQNNPITTVTGADGRYAFDNLYPGSYQVTFQAPADKTLVSATTVSGATGSTFATTSTDTSTVTATTSAVAVGTFAVVNSLYMVAMTAKPDTTTGLKGATQTVNLITNPDASGTDVPSEGSTVVADSVRLCDTMETSPNCTKTSVTVSGVGSYSVDANGLMTFIPEPNYTGTPTALAYIVMDTAGGTGASTYTPTVVGPPTATANTTSGPLNVAQSVNVLTNDTPGGSNGTFVTSSLTLSCPTTPTTPTCSVSAGAVTIAGQGTYTKAADGTVTFTPVTNYSGTPTPVKYTVTDSTGQSVSSTYTPTIIPPPTVRADTTTAGWDVTQSMNVITSATVAGTFNASLNTGDTAATGTTLKPNSLTIDCASAANCTETVVNGVVTEVIMAGQGTYTVDPATNVITFNPVNTFTGTARPVTYSISDELNQVSTTTYTPTVNPPTPPTADPETTSGPKGAAQTTDLLVGDATSAAGITLDPTSVRLCPATTTTPQTTTACNLTTLTVPGVGTYVVVDGVMTFTPEPNYVGTPPPVVYQVTDSVGGKASSTYTPTIIAPPTTRPDTTTAGWDVTQSMNVVTSATVAGSFNASLNTGDSAATGTTLKANSLTIDCASAANCTETVVNGVVTEVIMAGQGTYTVDPATNTITFSPVNTFTGTARPVTYSISDELNQVSSTTYTPTVTVPPIPTASPDTIALIAGGSMPFSSIFDGQTGDSDPALAAKGTGGPDLTNASVCLIDPATSLCDTDGIVAIAGEGTYTLDPTTGIVTYASLTTATEGAKTPVTYQITDGLNRSVTNTLTPTIYPKPTADDDISSGAYDTNQTITPFSNDDNVPSHQLGELLLCGNNPVQTPNNCDKTSVTTADGVYTVVGNTVVFNPDPDFVGQAIPVRYQAKDDMNQFVNALITPTVLPPAPPTADPETTTGRKGAVQSTDLLVGDATSDPDITLVPTSVRLCPATTTTPQTTTACNLTTLSVPGVGTYTVVDGVMTFTPEPNYVGTPPAVVYQVTDSLGGKASSTYTPTVIGTPTALADTTTGGKGLPQNVNLLTNPNGLDSPATGATLDPTSVKLCDPNPTAEVAPDCTKTSVTVAGVGTYSVDSTGKMTFTPDSNYVGTPPALSYTVTDSLGSKASSTYTPTVIGTPTATADTSSGPQGVAQSRNVVTNTSGTSDAAAPGTNLVSSTVTLSCASAPNCTRNSDGTVTIADQGTYSAVAANGTVVFTPTPTFTGTATPVTYTVSDALGQSATTTYTPTVIPAPVAINDTSTNGQDINQLIDVLNNDTVPTNPPGDLLNPTTVKLCGTNPAQSAPNCTLTTLTTPDGTYSVNQTTGVVTFDPIPSFTGTVSVPVRYQVSDSGATPQITSALITPTVIPGPTAFNDTSSGPMNTAQTKTLVTNDSAASGATLNAASVKLCATANPTATPPVTAEVAPNCTKTSVTVPNVGTYSVDSSGVMTFTPVTGYSGTPAPLSYTVTDNFGVKATATYTPTIIPPPTTRPDTTTAGWDVTQSMNVVTSATVAGSFNASLNTGDSAATGTTLKANSLTIDCASATNCTETVNGSGVVTEVIMAGQGTYTVNTATNVITFNPVDTFTGTARPVTYTISDELNQVSTTTYTPTVTVPPAPTATPDTVELIPGQSKVFSSIFDGATGDSDPALATKGTGAPDLTNASVCLLTPGTTTCDADGIVTIPGEGTYTLNPTTGIVTYAALSTATPGAKTPITYKITDGLNRSVTSTLTPTITPPPVANPDFSTGVQGAIQTLSPVGNDRPGGGASTELFPDTRAQIPSGVFLCAANQPPPDCAASTVTVTDPVTNATLGVLTVAASGLVTFTPEPNFVGTTPPIGYQIPDNLGQKAYSTITITVVPPPAPSATIDTGSAEYNKPVTLKPWINDSAGSVPAGSSAPAPSLIATSIKLCGDNSTFVAMSTTPADCTATKVKTVEGTYEVNATTGEVTFTPNPNMIDPITGLATGKGFVGTVKYPPTYQIWNNWTGLGGAKSATALLVPTIAPPGAPAATVDITKTKPGTSVVLNPVSNDTPGTAALDPTSIRLCGTGEISPACTQMSVTTLDGLYVVEPTTGQVTFTPREGFTGQATIPYVIKDGLGMMANANLIITVEDTAVVPVAKKTKVGLAKTGGTRPDLLLLLGLVAIAAAGGLRVLGRKK